MSDNKNKWNKVDIFLLMVIILIITSVIGIIIFYKNYKEDLMTRAEEKYGTEFCDKNKADHDINGKEGLTFYKCELCGREYHLNNTAVPKLCPKCAALTRRCEKCGKLKEDPEFNNMPKKEDINTEETNIIKRKEFETNSLLGLDTGIDLVSIEMVYDIDCNLYHKVITNMDEYDKFIDRMTLPKMKEEDFNDKVIVIVANKDERIPEENNLYISDIRKEDKDTIVVMKQKEETSTITHNLFYALVKKDALGGNVKVVIE